MINKKYLIRILLFIRIFLEEYNVRCVT